MSEVKRYRFKGAAGEYVYANDYDAAQAELSALREELGKFDEGMRALACSLGAGGYNAETLTADQLVGKVQWGIDNVITVQEQRLKAAEQRNDELEVLLMNTAEVLRSGNGYGWEDAQADIIDAALAQPTESGASE